MAKDQGPNGKGRNENTEQGAPGWDDEAPTMVREPSNSQQVSPGPVGTDPRTNEDPPKQPRQQPVHDSATFSGSIPLNTAELQAVVLADDPPTIPGTKTTQHSADRQGDPYRSANSSVRTMVSVPKSAQVTKLGDYPLIEALGAGGMANIYKSRQISLRRTVALKVLKPAVANEEQFAMRFEMEAQTLAELQHENIVQIYDHREDDGLQYMVMEYVEGIDLFDLMDKCGPLPPDIAAIISLHVARALEHIHYRGIVHRDIKPANIMVSYSGATKLMDFGIARVDADQDLTQHGMGLGTPSYMSPEQVLGDKLDGRTDIFSLGTVMFQMVTGRRPFVEDEQETVLQKIRNERAPRARQFRPDIPRDLDRIIGRCHQRRPGDRYWPTRELVRALERFLAALGVESENVSIVRYLAEKGVISPEMAEQQLTMARRSGYRATKPIRHTHKGPGRRPALVVAGLALVAGIAFFAGWWLGPVQSPKNTENAPQRAQSAIHEGPPRNDVAQKAYRGGIEVLAKPWAEIFVDGRRMATTPLAGSIRLSPGKHVVVLKNPYCHAKKVPVTIQEGKTIAIKETLECSPSPQKRAPR